MKTIKHPARSMITAATLLSVFAATPAWATPTARAAETTQRMSSPTLNDQQVGTYANGQQINLNCYVHGQSVKGHFSPYIPGGWDDIWYWTSDTDWVADVDIETGSNNPVTPPCDTTPASGTSGKVMASSTQGMSGSSLNAGPQRATYARGLRLGLSCYARGQSVKGYYSPYIAGGYDNLWYRTTAGTWVADVDLDTGSNSPITPACSPATPAPVHRYNRTNAVAFALKYYNTQNYATIPPWGFNDCTLFVSDALSAGGLPNTTTWTRSTSDKNLLASSRWDKGPTKNYAHADFLKNYLRNSGLATVSAAPLNWSDKTAGGAQLGDIIGYDWDFEGSKIDYVLDHSAIVTEIKPDGTRVVTQHNPNQYKRTWNIRDNGTPISVASRGSHAYLIHITW